MSPGPRDRRIRQLLETDRLLGADAVPFRPVEPRPPAEAEAPPARTPLGAGESVLRPTALSPTGKRRALERLRKQMEAFLEENWPRTGWRNVVFGDGDPAAELMFIGEAPGADEDRQGLPFVGRAGQLLEKQIEAMGLRREEVYIANILKTRPPGNRIPSPEEAQQCMPFLLRQIEIIHPRVIVALGATAAKYLLDDPKLAITRHRGQWRRFHGIDLMPTFHPAYLLRAYTPDNRRRVWDDLKEVLRRLGRQLP